MSRRGRIPPRAICLATATSTASAFFMSTAPRPCRTPPSTSPPNGCRFHSPGSAGTTSRWPCSSSAPAPGSAPSIRATTLARPGADSRTIGSRPASASRSATYSAAGRSRQSPPPLCARRPRAFGPISSDGRRHQGRTFGHRRGVADTCFAAFAGGADPALIVDAAVLKANIGQMAARARSAGVGLWPHVKTHKSKEVARLQLAAGAAGLTAATITEAEAMAVIGAAQLLVAYPPVDRWRIERLLALSRRARVSTVVDNAATAVAIDQACQRADCDLGLLWEVDSGTGRLGTEPGPVTAAEVAAVVRQLTRVRFCGVMTFAGHVYSAAAGQGVRRAAEEEIRAVRVTAAALAALTIPCPVLSIGSSPTAHHLDEAARGLQCRPGVYAYNDRTQVALGVADESSCALTVLPTVISRPAPIESSSTPARRRSPATRCAPTRPGTVLSSASRRSRSTGSTKNTPSPICPGISICRSGAASGSSPITPAQRRTCIGRCSCSTGDPSPGSGPPGQPAGAEPPGGPGPRLWR